MAAPAHYLAGLAERNARNYAYRIVEELKEKLIELEKRIAELETTKTLGL